MIKPGRSLLNAYIKSHSLLALQLLNNNNNQSMRAKVAPLFTLTFGFNWQLMLNTSRNKHLVDQIKPLLSYSDPPTILQHHLTSGSHLNFQLKEILVCLTQSLDHESSSQHLA